MVVVLKKKVSDEIIRIPAHYVAFDGDWFAIWYGADNIYDCNIFVPEDWQIKEICDE